MNSGRQIHRYVIILNLLTNQPLKFCLEKKSGQKYLHFTQSPKSGPKNWMYPQSAAIAGSGNLLKSCFESEIWAKIFSKSTDPLAYSPPSKRDRLHISDLWRLASLHIFS